MTIVNKKHKVRQNFIQVFEIRKEIKLNDLTLVMERIRNIVENQLLLCEYLSI